MQIQQKHPLHAGYFDYDGKLARRQEQSQKPQIWTGSEWRYIADHADFMMEATPIEKEQAEKMAHQQGVELPLDLLK